MNVFSEENKIVNAIQPVADAFAAEDPLHLSDTVNLENYRKCTFIIATGATTTANGVVTVLAGATNVAPATAITFKYRTQIAAVPPAVGSDIPSTLTDAAVGGFAMTASMVGGVYIVEVDAAVVAAAGAGFDHCSLHIAENANDPQTACVIAILSDPRYPQDILGTAID